MKSVLISIQPRWVELIASGKKTVEVRKTKPKLETPFKCYIYMTMGKCPKFVYNEKLEKQSIYEREPNTANGKVIGSFVCDRIENFLFEILDITYMLRNFKGAVNEEFFEGTQVTYQEAYDYCKGMDWNEDYSDIFYGWHISNLVIYDKPRELSEFVYASTVHTNCFGKCTHRVTRPPQSWCYVESEGEG